MDFVFAQRQIRSETEISHFQNSTASAILATRQKQILRLYVTMSNAATTQVGDRREQLLHEHANFHYRKAIMPALQMRSKIATITKLQGSTLPVVGFKYAVASYNICMPQLRHQRRFISEHSSATIIRS
jgi:hypothetical protein